MFFTTLVMGIYDRDYMKDSKGKSDSSGKDDVINLNEILLALVKLVVVFLAVILSLRFPFIWIKIPLALAVLFFGCRWILRVGKKPNARPLDSKISKTGLQADSRKSQPTAIDRFEAAVSSSSKPGQDTVRLLVAYDAAGEFGKAKTLIQSLNGEEFSETVGEELRVLAANYFPIELEPTEGGVRFKLA